MRMKKGDDANPISTQYYSLWCDQVRCPIYNIMGRVMGDINVATRWDLVVCTILVPYFKQCMLLKCS